MTKRIISMALAAVSLLGLWVPVYADEAPDGQPVISEAMDEQTEGSAPEESAPPAETPAGDDDTVGEVTEGEEDVSGPEEGGSTGAISEGEETVTGDDEIEGQAVDPLRIGQKRNVNGKWYCYDAAGKKVFGWQIIKDETGAEQKYYFDKKKSGQMATGWKSIKGTKSKTTRKYYFDPKSGALLMGKQTIGKYTYYLQEGQLEDEAAGGMKTGWQEVDGKQLYFKTKGSGSGRQLFGLQNIFGTKYYLDPVTGEKKTGLQVIGKYTYYFQEGEDLSDPKVGAMKTGWQEVGGKQLYFKTKGSGSGRQLFGLQNIFGTKYYLDPATGEKKTGLQVVGKYTYYFQEGEDLSDPKVGGMKTGWQTVSGKQLYFKTKGSGSGRQLFGLQNVFGTTYYLDTATGEKKTGLQVINDKKYYFREGDLSKAATGAMLTGWQTVGSNKYYFNKSGVMLIGLTTISGKRYLLKEGDLTAADTGAVQYGWQELRDGRHYFETKNGAMVTGFQTIGGDRYYFNSNGVMLTGWQTISGKKFYFDANGVMAIGWTTIDGNRYYFSSSTGMASGVTYMREYDDMYCFTSEGVLVTDADVELLSETYHVDGNGRIEGYMTDPMRSAVKVLDKVGWNLKAAFKWSSGLRYSNKWLRAKTTPHTTWYANYGFKHKTGNCYVMACTFYQMAKVLGYEVYFVEGYVRSTATYNAPHGWVEIILNGKTYVYDASFANGTGRNGYQIWYKKPGTWQYVNYKRAS